jgi:acyl-CoA reductase-like NAD-dependent aldehyde dehydrogenase
MMQTQLFINGKFVPAEDGATLPVLNPHDNSVIAEVAMAGKADIDKAVAAAKAAFPKWSRMAAMDRGRLLLKLADAIEANADELARLESMDTGHPLRDTRNLDVPRTAVTFRYFGGMADKLEGSVIPVEAGFLNYMLREPVGVVGQVVPWNFPLMFTSWKMAPALAAGNCIVMKPAELTPLATLRIAELMAEVGFPEGVVNIVPGLGHIAGQYMAEHEEIAKIAFTGSTATGRRIVQASAGNLKKIQLELGGKGANIVFGDANVEAAVNGSAFAIFHNQGQACIAGSRLILHKSIADEFTERFARLAASIKIGNPLDPQTELGPLTSLQHRDRVLSYVDVARSEGGEVVFGGKVPSDPRACRRLLRPADHRPRQADRPCQPGRGIRSLRRSDHLRDRRGSAGNCQRHRIRLGRRPVDQQSDPGAPDCARDEIRHGLDQLLQAGQPCLSLRRRRQVRLWPRDGVRGHAGIHPGQVGVGQYRRQPATLLPALTARSTSVDVLACVPCSAAGWGVRTTESKEQT